ITLVNKERTGERTTQTTFSRDQINYQESRFQWAAKNVPALALYFNPLLLHRIENNPFKLESREYPVDYSSPFERIYMSRISIPEGYVEEEIPQAKVIALPANAGRFTYSITQAGNLINIVNSFQINKSIFSQAEYPNLREFYNQVVAKQTEQIVLKKKK
ncbi:MAG: hypothetical protein RI909_790, partial [Bacteroidota bacterium]